MADTCGHGNEFFGSVIFRTFFDWLSILLAPEEGLFTIELISQYTL